MLLLFLSWFYARNIGNLLYEEATSNIVEITEQAAGRIGERTRNPIQAVSDLGDYLAAFYVKSPGDALRVMRDVWETTPHGAFIDISLVDLNGLAEGYRGNQFSVAEEENFHIALRGENTISRPFVNRKDGEEILAIYSPIFYKGEMKAILRGVLRAKDIARPFNTPFYKGQGFSYLIDNQGRFIIGMKHHGAHQGMETLFEIINTNPQETPKSEDILHKLQKGEAGTADINPVGSAPMFLSYSPLRNGTDWFFLSVVPEALMFENAHTVVLYSTLLCALIVGVFLCGSLLFLVERGRYQKRIARLAYVDTLTGLWNKNYLDEYSSQVLQWAKTTPYASVLFDINKFKLINESFGYENGNLILQVVASILQKQIRKQELAIRVNSDLFMLLLIYTTKAELEKRIYNLFAEINACLDEKKISSGRVLFTGGVYLLEDADLPSAKLYDYADIARKSIKSQAESSLAFFHDALLERMQQEKQIEDAMEGALANESFLVYMQAKVDIATNRIRGAEALVRWQNAQYGLLAPGVFIPLFEKNGFIVELDFYVFEKVCRWKQNRRLEGKPDYPISVNLSRAHLQQKHFVEKLIAISDRYGIARNTLELEITETAFFEDNLLLIQAMRALKDAGFRLSMDDFGTGYSSLNLLKNLPIDVLKIDKEFLNESEVSEKSKVVISSIINMADRLDVEVICEGVETRKQADFLLSIGCSYAQGYFFAKPLPLPEFEVLLAKDNTQKEQTHEKIGVRPNE